MLEKVSSADAATYRPVVMDFGLARESGEGKGLTASGTMMGTPAYMPPEQARGESALIDRRSDVYSLGATLYELIAGMAPFDGTSMVEILFKVINHQPRALRASCPTVPEALETIVSKCLNKDPDRRYPSAQALADDLSRFLRGEPILGKKLSALHRLSWRARRNKPVTALVVMLLVCVIIFASDRIRARARRTAQAQRESRRAQIAQTLLQEVEGLEWQMRVAYFSPLHDTTPEKDNLRQRLAKIDRERPPDGDGTAGLYHYVLGRGHLVLHAFKEAESHLRKAEAAGFQDQELDFALVRLLDERYRKAVEHARILAERNNSKHEEVQHNGKRAALLDRQGAERAKELAKQRAEKEDIESEFLNRRQDLERVFFVPIRAYLQKSRGLSRVSIYYLQALIDYYNHQYGEALRKVALAQRETPWFYESLQLEGDIHTAKALDQLAQGSSEQAEKSYRQAIASYERATAFGRSDYRLYESIAKSWNALMALDTRLFASPADKLPLALAAAEKAIQAAPSESMGATHIAQSYNVYIKYLQSINDKDRLPAIQQAIAAGEEGILVHPEDPEAYRLAAEAYMQHASYLFNFAKQNIALLEADVRSAEERLNVAIELNPDDYSIYASIVRVYSLRASHLLARGEDPTPVVEFGIGQTQRAMEIDAGQIEYSVQVLLAYLILARHNADYGKNSAELIARSAELAASMRKVNDYRDRTILGSIACAQASYCLDVGCPVTPLVDAALQDAKEAMSNSRQRSYRPYVLAAWAYAIKARSELLRSGAWPGARPGEEPRKGPAERSSAQADEGPERFGDPEPAIRSGLEAAQRCLTHAPQEAYCHTYMTSLLTTEAEWQRAHGRSPYRALNEALAAARQAVREAGWSQEADANLIAGRVSYELARSLLLDKRPPRGKAAAAVAASTAIDEGLSAIDSTLASRPGRPHALARQGALYLLRAELAKTAAERTSFTQRARQSLSAALAKNPSLAGTYGDTLADAGL